MSVIWTCKIQRPRRLIMLKDLIIHILRFTVVQFLGGYYAYLLFFIYHQGGKAVLLSTFMKFVQCSPSKTFRSVQQH